MVLKSKQFGGIKIIDIAITFGIFALFCLLSPFAPLTKYGMVIVGTFLAMIYSWTRELRSWVVVILILSMSVTNNEDFISSTIPKFLGNPILWTFLFAFVFVFALERTGLTRYATNKVMSSRLAKKGPYALMAIILIGTGVISALTQAGVGVFLLNLAMIKQISRQLGLKRYNMWSTATAINCWLIAAVGQLCVPYNILYPVIYGIINSYGGTAPSHMISCLISIIIFVLLIPVVIITTKYLIRPDIDNKKFEGFELEMGENQFTRQMRYGVLSIAVVAVIVIAPLVLPKHLALTTILANYGLTGAFVIAALILCFIKQEDGSFVFDFDGGMKESLPWNLIWFLGGTFYLADYLTLPDVGFVDLMGWALSPLSGINPVYMVIVLAICLCCMTNVLSNFVSALVVIPVAVQLCSNCNPQIALIMAYAIPFTMGAACALPSSCVGGSLLHNDEEFNHKGQLIGWGLLYSLLYVVVMLVVSFVFKGLFA